MLTVYSQIADNTWRSIFLLLCFPVIIFVVVWLSAFVYVNVEVSDMPTKMQREIDVTDNTNEMMIMALPWVIFVSGVWIVIGAWQGKNMILGFAEAKPLKKKDNPEVYRLVENIAITAGIKKTPEVYIIPDDSLNAFATGWSPNSSAIALTRGIIKKLDKAELEAVIAHEMGHIKNRDIRLMLIAITIVGIFSFAANIALRSAWYSAGGRDNKGKIVIVLIGLITLVIGVFGSTLVRLALSRKREYLADASSALLTRRPEALASALKKIEQDPKVELLDKKKSVATLCIDDPLNSKDKRPKTWSWLTGFFATHPPIDDRIKKLKEMSGLI